MANSNILKDLTEKLRYSILEFEEAIGVGKSRISQAMRRNQPITPDTVEKILTKFPQVNRKWLENGTGPMFLEDKPLQNEGKQVPFSDFMEAPYLSATAQAGYAKGFEDYNHPETDETMLVPREFEKGNYLVIEVAGDSMDDGTSRSICNGDKLLLKELTRDNWVFKLQFKQHLFVIVTREGVICKQIIEHDLEQKTITCHSYNRTLKDFTLSLENDVRQIFYVKKIVEKKLQNIDMAPTDERKENSVPNSGEEYIGKKSQTKNPLTKGKENKTDISSELNNEEMIKEILQGMRDDRTIAATTANALDKFGDAYKEMASIMKMLVAERHTGGQGEKKAG